MDIDSNRRFFMRKLSDTKKMFDLPSHFPQRHGFASTFERHTFTPVLQEEVNVNLQSKTIVFDQRVKNGIIG
jgi:hypothetical protein